MTKGRKGSKPPLVSGEANDPKSMRPMMARFLEWMQVRNHTPRTLESYERALRYFAAWTEERGIEKPAEVMKALVEQYQRHLFYRRKADGKPLSYSTQLNLIHPMRSFFRWLSRSGFIEANPSLEMDLPRQDVRLPQVILTPSQAESVINQPNVKTALGLRDRAILETLYSTGMRRMELVALTVYAVSPERGTVMIRRGKGRKDRLIPIAPRALGWLDKYLAQVRPELVDGEDPGAIFLSVSGKPLTPDELSQIVSAYVRESGVSAAGACHLFRHCVATGMLENGADLRAIQELLGHQSVDTTTIYAHLSIEKLREVHAATHPGNRREPEPAALKGDEKDDSDPEPK